MSYCCLDMAKLWSVLRKSCRGQDEEELAAPAVVEKLDCTVMVQADGATLETLISSADFQDARECARPESLDATIRATAAEACAEVKAQFVARTPDWTVWSEKKGLKIESNKTCQSGSICGRGAYMWKDPPPGMDMDFVIKVMWDPDTKKKYDENTDKMVCFFVVDDDTNLTCQAFKGRYGFSGRYFNVVIRKQRENEDGVERLILGARSLPEELDELVHEYIEEPVDAPPERAAQIHHIRDTQVRGFAYVAGVVIERHPDGSMVIGYVNDADIVTSGVPRWIIDRVKLDQLSVVKNVPAVLLAAWQAQK